MKDSREKFGKIYDKYIDKIFRFVFVKVDSQQAAEDLTSEVFSKTWAFFKKKGDEIENIQAFLYKTARNLVVDYYRQKGRVRIVSTDDPVHTGLIDPNQNLVKTAELNSDIRNIKSALTGLKDDYQNVIICHYLNDMSISEISKTLGKTEGNTRVLLHRALESLKKKVEKV